jgi:hypothetical protein
MFDNIWQDIFRPTFSSSFIIPVGMDFPLSLHGFSPLQRLP